MKVKLCDLCLGKEKLVPATVRSGYKGVGKLDLCEKHHEEIGGKMKFKNWSKFWSEAVIHASDALQRIKDSFQEWESYCGKTFPTLAKAEKHEKKCKKCKNLR